jgi:signal transduction histidine kinase
MPKMVKEKVDLKELILSAKDFHQGEGGVSIQFETVLFDPCYVLTDKEQMIRVFNNLIRNAVQAMREGEFGKINLLLVQIESKYLVSIADNGTGISEDLKDKIFNPNFTTKNAGMGLGLALVREIARAHGAWWNLISGPQMAGVRITILFPGLRKGAQLSRMERLSQLQL